MTSYFETNYDKTSSKKMFCLLLLHKTISVIVNENVIQDIHCITYLLAFFIQEFCASLLPASYVIEIESQAEIEWVIKLGKKTFLGHLSHSGGLLLWVSVRCQAPCVNIFFQRTTWPILTKFGMQNLQDNAIRNCKFHYPHHQGEVIWG